MEIYPSAASNTAIKARSVQVFIKRVIITFITLILVGIFVIFFLIYLPLNNALETSLINNFSQISTVNYNSVQNSIQRGLEGARSLSSRTMIKNAIIEYNNKEIDIDELISYTQPKYEDGAKALEHLVLSERFVGKVSIARYAPSENEVDISFADKFLEESAQMDSKLYLAADHVYFTVLSPVVSNNDVLGYDKLIFDLTGQIQVLCTDTTETALLYDDVFQDLISDAEVVSDNCKTLVFYKSGFYFQAIGIQDDIYFVSKQSRDVLLASIYLIGIRIFVAGIGILLAFIIVVYLHVVRFAKRELMNLETSHITLRKAASEANTDTLTKAGNRRYGTEYLMGAFKDFQTNGLSPTVVMFDIDSFKSLNDTYGHYAGDQVLIEVVDAVQKNIREVDKLFRWGGDEFVGVVHGLKEEDTISFAHKILNTVSSLKINAVNGMISPTVSIGISYFKNEDTEFTDALNRADQAMYRSKAEGRNRVNVL